MENGCDGDLMVNDYATDRRNDGQTCWIGRSVHPHCVDDVSDPLIETEIFSAADSGCNFDYRSCHDCDCSHDCDCDCYHNDHAW